MTTDDAAIEAVLEVMWARNGDRVRARLSVVAAGLDVLASSGHPDPEAGQEAHALAGILGTYGRPGSALMRRAELALMSGSHQDAVGLLAEVRALASALRT